MGVGYNFLVIILIYVDIKCIVVIMNEICYSCYVFIDVLFCFFCLLCLRLFVFLEVSMVFFIEFI